MHPALVITGMHRSGTSLVASLLESAGMFIGHRIMPAGHGNAAGHFEDMDFYDLHRQALQANGYHEEGFVRSGDVDLPPALEEVACRLIHDREKLDRPWGWKDPRTVLFLEPWSRLLPHAYYLFVFRAPWEVVDSLYRRGDIDVARNPRLAVDAWIHYNQLIRDFVRKHPKRTLLCELSTIIRSPQALIDGLHDRFGIALSAPRQVYRADLLNRPGESFGRRALEEAAPQCTRLYRELRALASFKRPTRDKPRSRQTGIARRGSDSVLIDWSRTCQQRARLQELDAELALLRQQDERRERDAATLAETHRAHVAELERRIHAADKSAQDEALIAARERAALVETHRAHVAELERRIHAADKSAQEEALIAARERAALVETHRAHVAELEHRIHAAEASLLEASRTATHERTELLTHHRDQLGNWEQERREMVGTISRRECECRELRTSLNSLTEMHRKVITGNSWRLTRPFREARRWLAHPRRQARQASLLTMRAVRLLYDRLPLEMSTRLKHRRFLARRLPALLVAAGSPPETVPGLRRSSAPAALTSRARQHATSEQGCRLSEPSARTWNPIRLPSNSSPVVSIVIPVHNQWSHTYACLESIVHAEPDLAYEVILADDRSTDETMHASRWVTGMVIQRNATNLGFLRNCNAASKRAVGKYLLFLNNDTEIQPGAISKLLAVFEDSPDAGLVGSKLVYPDGRLQEAGGIVWRDGTAWNYGRGQDPGRSSFNYRRETDYCSGAAIMVLRDLFARVGGFDERYAPAYYEDTDLAFAVRAAGYNVYYQPESVVVHHEGVSYGADESSRAKAHQAANRSKFVDKWRGTLEREHFPNGENVFHARDRSAGKRCVLVVDHYIPQPDRDAGSRVLFAFLRIFRSMGLMVKFLPQNLHYDAAYAPALERLGVEVCHGEELAGGFDDWIRRHGQNLDFAFLSRPDVANEFLSALRRHSRARLLFYGHDLHHARMLREAAVTGDVALESRAHAMRRLEESVWRQVDAVYYPSAEETATVVAACPGVSARTVPLYFFEERKEPTPGPRGRRGIVFVAGFAHPPNVDAAEWLVDGILPLVLREAPHTQLWLVGSNPTAAVQRLASADVTVTGYVSEERLAEIYHTARVAVVPLRFGAGVKSKVIEALHHGLPLVTTPVGAQGLEGLERILPVSADASALARGILELLRDDDRWADSATAGQEYVKSRFSAEAMQRAFKMDFTT